MSSSGGKDRKSRSSKTQGWEEAGGEFYQESYPVGADWDGMQRDPAAIATLLPSKQNRYATTRRVRPGQNDNRTSRRRQSVTGPRRTSTFRGAQIQEVQVAMLPDLSENLTDEERIWEEIHEIKAMPVTMGQKKEMKAQLQNATKLRLQGFDQIKWQRRKAWQQLCAKWTECLAKVELWKGSLKRIEGHFGTGVVAYFLFLRWLMFLNLAIFGIVLVFVVLPQVFLVAPDEAACVVANSTECCAEDYFNATSTFSVLDIIQGTGIMEKTLMFYGMYSNRIYGYHANVNTSLIGFTKSLYYDLPLAFVCTTLACFLLSLVAIVRAASREFKDRLVEGEGQFYQYCNLIFGGWDFCIHNEKSAEIKHKALFNEIKGLLLAKKMEFERFNRTSDIMAKLIVMRFLINCLVLMILAASAVIIYYLLNISLAYLDPNFTPESILSPFGAAESGLVTPSLRDIFTDDDGQVSRTLSDQLIVLFYEFLPYIAIVLLNFLVPILFNYLVQFEQYSPVFVIKMALLRTILLRLSSLAVLLSRFYLLVSPQLDDQVCYNASRGTPQCWETFVGQQLYKLFIIDFVTHIFVTFFINFPRALIARHVNTRLARFVGEQEFELSKHVLDIVYSQTLCWLGSFYAPFLAGIAFLLNFLMFYIKKFACLVNSKPSEIHYRASRSKSLFMFILLLSFAIAVAPVVYAVAEILPSRSCGPFRGLTSVWAAAIAAFMKMPSFIQNAIFFFGTAAFAVPAFIVLILLLYYYYAVSAANKHMVNVLKNQLVLEGRDKQFLLNRLSSFIKQHQDYQKKMRQAERNRESRNSRNAGEREAE
ncbi:transmembrane channel-like protein 7 [Phlebotomus argentipes]|uniref:transmembrane channel-like protein 7 n=1 Tax=Phlebotomus argentipes TaxID=94469 RepID=UPI002893672C|nr:transmembrane channel-like protein 7 [Phlebotomus argentipes]XP_059608528.1 transmembrane channel-like protein 7 [Phlebotomus argentipes]